MKKRKKILTISYPFTVGELITNLVCRIGLVETVGERHGYVELLLAITREMPMSQQPKTARVLNSNSNDSNYQIYK